MKLLKSLFSLLISIALISLLFWGLSKFVSWFPTINGFIFYFLSFWFVYVAYKLFSSMLRSIEPLKTLVKATGYTAFQIFRIATVVILLILCLLYLGQTILTNKDLYNGWQLIGLISFCIFTIQISLSFLNQFLLPIND